MKKKIIISIFFALTMQGLFGADIQLTEKEAGLYLTPEFNRTFYSCWNFSAEGGVKINDRYGVMGGLAMGTAGTIFEIKAFAGGEAAFPLKIPLVAGLLYNYNGLPDYENHIHSILPLVSLKWRLAGVSAGVGFRFNSFFGETLFEPVISASVYVNFVNNDNLRLGIRIATFDNYTVYNFGGYFLNFNSKIRLGKLVFLVNDIELHQSGSVGLASNFYRFVYRGGATLSW